MYIIAEIFDDPTSQLRLQHSPSLLHPATATFKMSPSTSKYLLRVSEFRLTYFIDNASTLPPSQGTDVHEALADLSLGGTQTTEDEREQRARQAASAAERRKARVSWATSTGPPSVTNVDNDEEMALEGASPSKGKGKAKAKGRGKGKGKGKGKDVGDDNGNDSSDTPVVLSKQKRVCDLCKERGVDCLWPTGRGKQKVCGGCYDARKSCTVNGKSISGQSRKKVKLSVASPTAAKRTGPSSSKLKKSLVRHMNALADVNQDLADADEELDKAIELVTIEVRRLGFMGGNLALVKGAQRGEGVGDGGSGEEHGDEEGEGGGEGDAGGDDDDYGGSDGNSGED